MSRICVKSFLMVLSPLESRKQAREHHANLGVRRNSCVNSSAGKPSCNELTVGQKMRKVSLLGSISTVLHYGFRPFG